VEKRRRFEADANQEYAERLLVRAECIRQRERAEAMAGWIERLMGDQPQIHVPDYVQDAMRAVFPGEDDAESEQVALAATASPTPDAETQPVSLLGVPENRRYGPCANCGLDVYKHLGFQMFCPGHTSKYIEAAKAAEGGK
jgi:hypothetical protein